MLSATVPNDTVNWNHDICFEVLLYLANRLSRLQPGEILELLTSDAAASEKIQPWCEMRGFTLMDSQETANGRQRLLIRKG
jgi:TusA-related sulfurtransferase